MLGGVVRARDDLHYVQGLSSVAAAVALHSGFGRARTFLQRFMALHGRAFTTASTKETEALLGVVDTIIFSLDPELGAVLRSDPVLASHLYAMTWFAHTSESAAEAVAWLSGLSWTITPSNSVYPIKEGIHRTLFLLPWRRSQQQRTLLSSLCIQTS